MYLPGISRASTSSDWRRSLLQQSLIHQKGKTTTPSHQLCIHIPTYTQKDHPPYASICKAVYFRPYGREQMTYARLGLWASLTYAVRRASPITFPASRFPRATLNHTWYAQTILSINILSIRSLIPDQHIQIHIICNYPYTNVTSVHI